jgi:hypothetical protein
MLSGLLNLGDRKKRKEKKPIPIFFYLLKSGISTFFFSSEIGNFNIGGPENQLIKKMPKRELEFLKD